MGEKGGIGFELRHHMVDTLSTELHQLLRPITTTQENIESARKKGLKNFDGSFG